MPEFVTDEELMRRFARESEMRAFDELVSRHKESIVRYATRYVGNFHLGEELAQEAFVRVFENRSSFAHGSRFQPWLFTIVNNLCRNALRRRREVPLEPEHEPIISESIQHLEKSALQLAFEKLPEEQREALLLREFHEKSYEEIAQILNAPLNTVRSWIRRGRLQLCELLEDDK